ncbi:hypothetical protein WHY20_12670 [Clostridium perfringens]|uniref:hypothetical protein n=1 Tax=Clostridium perfringens TaxID=1502 RepID=UPI0030D07617
MNKKELLASLIEEMNNKSKDELISELETFEIEYTLEERNNSSYMLSWGKIAEEKLSGFTKINKSNEFYQIIKGNIEDSYSKNFASSSLYEEVHRFNEFSSSREVAA